MEFARLMVTLISVRPRRIGSNWLAHSRKNSANLIGAGLALCFDSGVTAGVCLTVSSVNKAVMMHCASLRLPCSACPGSRASAKSESALLIYVSEFSARPS